MPIGLSIIFSYGIKALWNHPFSEYLTIALTVFFCICLILVIIRTKSIFSLKEIDILIYLLAFLSIIVGMITNTVRESFQFLAMSLIFYFFGRILFLKRNDDLINWTIIFSIPLILNLATTLLDNNGVAWRLSISGASPIGIGELFTFFILACYYSMRYRAEKKKFKLIYITLIAIGFFLQISALSSRGAVITTVITIFFGEMLFKNFFESIKIFTLVAFLYALFNFYIEKISSILPIASRFSFLSILNSESISGSNLHNGRKQLVEIAWANIKNSPVIGKGFGNSYSHNIFLEIWSSLGIIGLVILLIILFVTVRNIIEYKFSINILVTLLLIATFVNRMSSFDYTSYKSLFFFLGLFHSNIMYRVKINGEELMK